MISTLEDVSAGPRPAVQNQIDTFVFARVYQPGSPKDVHVGYLWVEPDQTGTIEHWLLYATPHDGLEACSSVGPNPTEGFRVEPICEKNPWTLKEFKIEAKVTDTDIHIESRCQTKAI